MYKKHFFLALLRHSSIKTDEKKAGMTQAPVFFLIFHITPVAASGEGDTESPHTPVHVRRCCAPKAGAALYSFL